MYKLKKTAEQLLNRIDSNVIMLSVRRGMVLSMPVLMIGAIANLITNFPIEGYQNFISLFCGGCINQIFGWITVSTNSILSLVMILTISYSFACEVSQKYKIIYPVCALCSYLAFTAEAGKPVNINVFSIQWMFTAICVTLASCCILLFIFKKSKHFMQKFYAEGVDSFYQIAVSAILPTACVVLLAAILNFIITSIGGDPNIQNIGALLCRGLFEHLGAGAGGAVVYVLLIHLFWFFGIHGDNILAMVTYLYFVPPMTMNAEQIAAGGKATAIFSYPFFNYFVLMGGTGATLCLLLALFLVSKKSNNRRLAKMSTLPAIFNINEPILWGLPIILNPIMFIPFLAAPMAAMLISALFMKLGLVPVAVHDVGYTLPVIFSGIKTTGDISGGILQIINIVIGTAIYIPFVRLSENRQTKMLKDSINELKDMVMEAENSETEITLLNNDNRLESTASMLIDDLHHAMKRGEVKLYYQPQIRHDGSVLGAEALLRWKHPVLDDFIYPPLVIQLAKEDRYLDRLGLWIINDAAKTLAELAYKTKEPLKISVNISSVQLENPTFCEDVIDILDKYDFGEGKLAIEITEQTSLSVSPVILKRIDKLRNAGIEFIMDDFGMGHSSMMNLKNTKFSYVKLDGNMVKDLLHNNRISDIIVSIEQLSKSLDFEIIAEYVEKPEQRDKLEALGCKIYQGWLYSKAVAVDEFKDFLKEHEDIKEDEIIT